MPAYLTLKQMASEEASKKMDNSWVKFDQTTATFKENLKVLDTEMEKGKEPKKKIGEHLGLSDEKLKNINTTQGKINNVYKGTNSDLDDEIDDYDDYLDDYDDWLDDHPWADDPR